MKGEDAIVYDLTDSPPPPPRNGRNFKRRIEINDLEDISSDEDYIPRISKEDHDYERTKDDIDEQEVIDIGSSSNSGNSDDDYESDPIDNESLVDIDEAAPLDIDESFSSRSDFIPPVTFPTVSEHFWLVKVVYISYMDPIRLTILNYEVLCRSVESLKRNGACAIDFSAFTLSRGKQDMSYKDRKDTREKKKAAKDSSSTVKRKKTTNSDGKKKSYSSARWQWKKKK